MWPLPDNVSTLTDFKNANKLNTIFSELKNNFSNYFHVQNGLKVYRVTIQVKTPNRFKQ